MERIDAILGHATLSSSNLANFQKKMTEKKIELAKMAENVEADDPAQKAFAHVERLTRRFTPGRMKLRQWLNKYLKIEMTDGRILVGIFFCTDQAMNVILGNCSEYLRAEDIANDVEPRLLGLAMVPGHHIVTIHVDT